MAGRKSYQDLTKENDDLRARLAEAEETLRAIQNNEVDALIVTGPGGQQVYTLQGADEPYRILMETMTEGALTVAADGTILYCNKRFAEILHTPLNRIIGLPIEEIVLAEDHERLRAMTGAHSREVHKGEINFNGPDGKRIPVHASARSLQLQGVETICIVATDLTEQRRLEERLRQGQKMEALGTLSGGIAHDFNNILASIIGFAEMVLEDTPSDHPAHRRLGLILKAGTRGSDLVRRILSFSRQTPQETKEVSLSSVVADALNLLQSAFPATIEIRRRFHSVYDVVLADPVQIHQIFMNLCTNAAHAMKEKGGLLEIDIVDADISESGIPPYPGLEQGHYLRLSVSDTGCGMAPEIMSKVFDPFFTTKPPGEGTGLGLSVVHGIVKSHKGYIAVYSNPGKGSVFHVYLPKAAAFAGDRINAPRPVQGGKERILFVDDEDMLVEMNRQRLEKLGYHVVASTSGVEALRMFTADPQKFDLVITDYTMPLMTGLELAKALSEVRPGIPIILCSGLNEAISLDGNQESVISAFVPKTAGKTELADAIRRVLAK